MQVKQRQIFKSKMLCTTALCGLLIAPVIAMAQSFNSTGDNAILNGDRCDFDGWASGTCSGVTKEVWQNDVDASEAKQFPIGQTRAAAIGTTGVGNGTGVGSATVNGLNTTSRRLHIGLDRGANGTLNIENGGTWNTSSAATVGMHGTGTLNVSGVRTADDGSPLRSTFSQTDGSLTIGVYGTGTLNASDGALVKGVPSIVVGRQSTGIGVLNLSGFNTSHNLRSTIEATDLFVGYEGRGSALIDNGALVNVDVLTIARRIDTFGEMTVSNSSGQTAHRTTVTAMRAANSLMIGNGGTGVLNILDGSLVSTVGITNIGWSRTANGRLNIVGQGSEFDSTNLVRIGDDGIAATNVLDGGKLTAREISIANAATSRGTLNVAGQGSEVQTTNKVTIATNGVAEANLIDGGILSASEIAIAGGLSSAGSLNIGGVGDSGGMSGTVDTSVVSGGQGRASVNFNHLDDVVFDPKLTGRLTVNKRHNSLVTLTANSDYEGVTTVEAGVFAAGTENAFSEKSDYVVRTDANLLLNGFNQTIASLTHSGLVEFAGSGGAILTVNNGYIGDGGLFVMNTVLGDDNSLTDRLGFNTTTGNGYIKVNNVGGAGALTNEGIKIASVSNLNSDGKFSLVGDYTLDGKDYVVAGVYAYGLYQGSTSQPNDGQWYLRSTMQEPQPDPTPQPNPDPDGDENDPRYNATVPVYETYPQALLRMNRINTLRQRIGHRFYAEIDQAGAQSAHAQAQRLDSGNGLWLRVEGSRGKSTPAFSATTISSENQITRVQLGVDGILDEDEHGTWIGGVYGQYVKGKTTTNSIYGDGQIDTNGYGLGATLTYYGGNGFYIDGQANVTWYQSDIRYRPTQRAFVEGNDSLGYAFSLESGKSYALDQNWSITPQAQLVYSNVKFDQFTDVFSTSVSLGRGDSLRGRLGVSLDYETLWQDEYGSTNKLQLYGIANLYHEFLGQSRVDIAGHKFDSRPERLWGGIGIGGTYSWNKEQAALYGELLVDTSLENFGDSYDVRGKVGLRLKW